MEKLSHSFIPNVWIKGIYKNRVCIGRTSEHVLKDKKTQPLQLVNIITENGETETVYFTELKNLVQLRILTTEEFETNNLIQRDFKDDKQNLIRLKIALAKRQLKAVMS